MRGKAFTSKRKTFTVFDRLYQHSPTHQELHPQTTKARSNGRDEHLRETKAKRETGNMFMTSLKRERMKAHMARLQEKEKQLAKQRSLFFRKQSVLKEIQGM